MKYTEALAAIAKFSPRRNLDVKEPLVRLIEWMRGEISLEMERVAMSSKMIRPRRQKLRTMSSVMRLRKRPRTTRPTKRTMEARVEAEDAAKGQMKMYTCRQSGQGPDYPNLVTQLPYQFSYGVFCRYKRKSSIVIGM